MNFNESLLGKYFVLVTLVLMSSACSNATHVGNLVKDEFEAHSNSFKVMGRVKKDEGEAHFQNSVASYEKNLKYGYFKEAFAFVKSRDEKKAQVMPADIDIYRIHSYQTLSRFLSDNGREGRLVAEISYYEIDTGALVTIVDDQRWWFADVANKWFVANFIPLKGDASQD